MVRSQLFWFGLKTSSEENLMFSLLLSIYNSKSLISLSLRLSKRKQMFVVYTMWNWMASSEFNNKSAFNEMKFTGTNEKNITNVMESTINISAPYNKREKETAHSLQTTEIMINDPVPCTYTRNSKLELNKILRSYSGFILFFASCFDRVVQNKNSCVWRSFSMNINIIVFAWLQI